jgi:Uri superfamily endonuclease
MDSGVYHLLVSVRSGRHIKIGQLGRHWFPRGYYVYTGRAKKGLQKRLERHWRRDKKRRWHIDYLLHHAQLVGEKKCLTRAERECLLNTRILRRPDAQVIVKKFGASDCRCVAHLVYFRHRPRWLSLKMATRGNKAMLDRA